MIDKPGGTRQLHFDDKDDDKDDDEDEDEDDYKDKPVGGKDKESTVDGFAGEHVLFLLIANQESMLVKDTPSWLQKLLSFRYQKPNQIPIEGTVSNPEFEPNQISATLNQSRMRTGQA